MRKIVTALVAVAALAAAGAAQGAPAPQPYATNDGRGFRDVLPPGTDGVATLTEILNFLSTGQRPPHNADQLPLYRDLLYAAPGLSAQGLRSYFKDSTFGVRSGDVARTYSPRKDVTIVRDKGFGVPHVYGSTRDGAMFGTGYVTAEDRLFFIDVLRHVGRAQLTSFAGGAEGNREFERDQWRAAPYTEADLQRQIDQFPRAGAQGRRLKRDLDNYVAGINQYIAEAKVDPSKQPGEYVAIGQPLRPWKETDTVAVASLVGGIFGQGGGGELQQAQLLQAFRKRFGARLGQRLWLDFRSPEDPEAPTTVRGTRFSYEAPPPRVTPGSVAMPDRGSVKPLSVVESSSGGAAARRATSGLLPRSSLPAAQSNALVVSSRKSSSRRPLAVFGPQVGYFSPQILMEQDVHAPDLDARGAAFPGVNLYVELGRGRDYSWSATSAGQDIIDEYAVPLCEPGGGKATTASMGYRFRGKCLRIEVLRRRNAWTPNAGDPTPAGSETLVAQRTRYGVVIARATISGKPVAYTSLRSTYRHEVDSALGFSDFNTPSKIRGPRDFQRAASKIGYTFNWLYADSRDTAYFNSGNNPVRPSGLDPLLPVKARRAFEWKGWDPVDNTADYTPFEQHPQVINQSYMTSWNNKQAPGFRAAGPGFTPLYRSQLLDDGIRRRIRGNRRISLPGLVTAMEDAATRDLRGAKVLPWALKLIGATKSPTLAPILDTLRTWTRSGAHRRDLNRDGAYDDAEAVRIMDAWWPLWVRGEFKPKLGGPLLDRLEGALPFDNDPNNGGSHLGSAYQGGWYGYVQKDLRTLLGEDVQGRYARVFCGKGSRSACRKMLLGTLTQAIATPAARLYDGDPQCPGADQTCYDSIAFRALGGITQPLIPWQNRPTYQQAVSVRGRAPR